MRKICIELKNNNKINLELDDVNAPITVANFMHLVKVHFYDDLIFHRIIPGFMAQGGAFYIDENMALNQRTIGYTIPGEFINNGFENNLKHELGTISMARTDDPNSANTQFFICDSQASHLDWNYAAFGKISDQESLDTLLKISHVPTVALTQEFANFPNADTNDITIKTIYEVN